VAGSSCGPAQTLERFPISYDGDLYRASCSGVSVESDRTEKPSDEHALVDVILLAIREPNLQGHRLSGLILEHITTLSSPRLKSPLALRRPTGAHHARPGRSRSPLCFDHLPSAGLLRHCQAVSNIDTEGIWPSERALLPTNGPRYETNQPVNRLVLDSTIDHR
jgi:hypothetical protein